MTSPTIPRDFDQSFDRLVTIAEAEPQGWRTHRGERLSDLFEERCDWIQRYGDPSHLAVDSEDLKLTYPRLDRRANQLARYLRFRGVRSGDRVALLFDRVEFAFVAMLALSKINAAYVPLDLGFPLDRMAYIVEDAKVTMALSLSTARRYVPADELGVEMEFLDEAEPFIAEMSADRLIEAERGYPADQLAYIIYTSGSTGRPKGVAIEQPSICNFVRVAAEVYGIRPNDRMYQGLSIAFDFSVEEIWVPLAVGATLVPKPPGVSLVGADLHSFLTRRRITAFCCVPTLLATIEHDVPDLRFLLVSGEACPRDLIVRWYRPGRRFLNVYGPTEATVTATWTQVHPDKPVTIGVPLPSYAAVILDAAQPSRALPPGEVGEIGIAGIGLARGYLNRDDLTERAFIDDFLRIPGNPSGRIYRTGDLGRVNADGEIEYLGRIDLQVKIRGYRVELTEIESVLLQVPGIAAAVVSTYHPDSETTELVGYYSPRTDCPDIDVEDIYARLRERLPPYMVPAYLERLDVIPMTTSNKVDRAKLPPPSGRRITGATDGAQPQTDTERVLAEALCDTLRIDQVSVDSDFFADLGGNSLLMARFVATLRKKGGLPPISITMVYQHPTVRQLAGVLGEVAGKVATAPPADEPVPAQRGRIRPVGTGRYLLCGAAQLAFLLASVYLAAVLLTVGFHWVSAGTDVPGIFLRSAAFASAILAGWVMLPIAAKWLLIGRFQRGEIPLWSVAYLRFWLVRTLIRVNPMVLFAGSPLIVVYLRLLGAKIGRGVTIHSRVLPVATDLITIGDNSVLRRNCTFNGYHAIAGVLRFGSVTLGRDVHVGERTVLDIDTAIGDEGALGHVSALHPNQSVRAQETWHGNPAEPTSTNYRTVPPAPCGVVRKVAYSALLATMLFGAGSVGLAVLVLALTRITPLSELLDVSHVAVTGIGFYLVVLLVSFAVFFAGLVGALVVVMTVPRALHLLISPNKIYPLFGVRFIAQQLITLLTNANVFVRLFGDSSAIVHYLRVLGYDLGIIEQTGSNFGTEQAQDSPYLTKVGTGSMVSDGVVIMNAEYSGTSFAVRQATIGERNFLGNNIMYPAGGRTGENCLLGTKVMIPIDGPVRENTGLLGSPPFEIPRSVRRDMINDPRRDPVELRRRLRAKNRYNAASAGCYLLYLWCQAFCALLIAGATLDFFGQLGAHAIAVGLIMITLFSVAIMIVGERATLGFGRLRPRYCSIYDPYYWRHERFWKLLAAPMLFNGTPMKNLVWRLLGVRIGRRVFDDGCGIPEKTLVSIGDEAVLNAGSVVQCHSLEDGVFKSDYTTIGARVTLGVGAFVHYGVRMEDESVLAADSFLMKGAEVPRGTTWSGNPAEQLASPTSIEPALEPAALPRLRFFPAPGMRPRDRRGRRAPAFRSLFRTVFRKSPAEAEQPLLPLGHRSAQWSSSAPHSAAPHEGP